MRRFAGYVLLVCAAVLPAQQVSEEEQQHLQNLVREGSGSAADMVRAFEAHLAQYPDSPRKQELLRALAKGALQTRDQARIAKYGQAALASEPDNIVLLEAVCQALVTEPTPEKARAALKWAVQLESAVRESAKELPDAPADRARHKDETDRMLGRALLYQAIARGTLGEPEEAEALARKSFDTFPSGEAAAELGKQLARLGRVDEAVRAYADAFSMPDGEAAEADRAAIRRRMGELYQKAYDSEKGLGDVVLRAYDRTSALLAERKLALKQVDPNLGLTNPLEFTLTGLDGDRLELQSLLGKVVVMDFWATWCGPCRVQHPLYEKVKERFKQRSDVVFLAVNTDEDRSVVKPFLDELGWSKRVYFEDGLGRALRVSSIPTTVVFGKDGSIVSRMNGFDPDRFVDMLTDRIRGALGGAKEGE
jgi:thiol-disulfide isomerase/thioredoxin